MKIVSKCIKNFTRVTGSLNVILMICLNNNKLHNKAFLNQLMILEPTIAANVCKLHVINLDVPLCGEFTFNTASFIMHLKMIFALWVGHLKSKNTVRRFKFYFNFLTTEILRFLRYISLLTLYTSTSVCKLYSLQCSLYIS